MSVYLSTVFGYKNLGSLVGVLTTVGGLIGLTQTPLLIWAYAAADPATPSTPNFTAPNLLMLALVVVAFAWPEWLARRAGHRNSCAASCGRRTKGDAEARHRRTLVGNAEEEEGGE
jgi:hypothetical protein